MTADAEQKSNESEGMAWDEFVSGRARTFVLDFCTDEDCFMNGTRAYKSAYTKKNRDGTLYVPDDDVAAAAASRLLGKVKVKKAIRLLLRLARGESDERAGHRLIKLYETISFANPADILFPNGALKVEKDLSELGPLAHLIAGIETRPGKFGDYTVVRLVNQAKYREDYMRYLNLIREPEVPLGRVPVAYLSAPVTPQEWEKLSGTKAKREDDGPALDPQDAE